MGERDLLRMRLERAGMRHDQDDHRQPQTFGGGGQDTSPTNSPSGRGRPIGGGGGEGGDQGSPHGGPGGQKPTKDKQHNQQAHCSTAEEHRKLLEKATQPLKDKIAELEARIRMAEAKLKQAQEQAAQNSGPPKVIYKDRPAKGPSGGEGGDETPHEEVDTSGLVDGTLLERARKELEARSKALVKTQQLFLQLSSKASTVLEVNASDKGQKAVESVIDKENKDPEKCEKAVPGFEVWTKELIKAF